MAPLAIRLARALLSGMLATTSLVGAAKANDQRQPQSLIIIDEEDEEVVFDDGEDDVICILRKKIVTDKVTGETRIKTVPVCAEIF